MKAPVSANVPGGRPGSDCFHETRIRFGPARGNRWLKIHAQLGLGGVLTVLLAIAPFASRATAADSDGGSSAAGFAAVSDDDDAEPTGIENANFARVRALDGTATLERYEDESRDEASVNAPIYAGDIFATGSTGRTEIQLATGALVRLDLDSRLAFLSLPGSGSSLEQATLLQLSRGSMEVEIRGGGLHKGDFQIDAPGGSVYLLSNGRYRIDISARGSLHVASNRGAAEVAGENGSVTLHSGQRTSIDTHGVPEDPRSFNTISARLMSERECMTRPSQNVKRPFLLMGMIRR